MFTNEEEAPKPKKLRSVRRRAPPARNAFAFTLVDAQMMGAPSKSAIYDLKQFPAYLNRWDSQQARNEGVFWY